MKEYELKKASRFLIHDTGIKHYTLTVLKVDRRKRKVRIGVGIILEFLWLSSQ